MKCLKCGNEIAEGQSFCPYCGNGVAQMNSTPQQLQQINRQQVTNNGFNNLNSTGNNGFNNLNRNATNGANKILIMEFIGGILILVFIVFLIITVVSSNNNSNNKSMTGNEQSLMCTKSGEKLEQKFTFTYENDELKNYKVLYIIDSIVDEDTLTSSEQDELMQVAFSQMAFSKYLNTTGIIYNYDDSTNLVKISFEVDFSKVSSSIAKEIMPEDDRITYDKAYDYYVSNNFVCTSK